MSVIGSALSGTNTIAPGSSTWCSRRKPPRVLPAQGVPVRGLPAQGMPAQGLLLAQGLLVALMPVQEGLPAKVLAAQHLGPAGCVRS